MQSIMQQIDTFGPEDVSELYNVLTFENNALKAYGGLLEACDMEMFMAGPDAENRHLNGLKQLLDLCIERQERHLDGLYEKATNCPEWYINRAELLCGAGPDIHRDPSSRFKEADVMISKLEAIICQFGEKAYPKADKLRNDLIRRQEQYAAKAREKSAQANK
jgi:hypothetical protein